MQESFYRLCKDDLSQNLIKVHVLHIPKNAKNKKVNIVALIHLRTKSFSS